MFVHECLCKYVSVGLWGSAVLILVFVAWAVKQLFCTGYRTLQLQLHRFSATRSLFEKGEDRANLWMRCNLVAGWNRCMAALLRRQAGCSSCGHTEQT